MHALLGGDKMCCSCYKLFENACGLIVDAHIEEIESLKAKLKLLNIDYEELLKIDDPRKINIVSKREIFQASSNDIFDDLCLEEIDNHILKDKEINLIGKAKRYELDAILDEFTPKPAKKKSNSKDKKKAIPRPPSSQKKEIIKIPISPDQIDENLNISNISSLPNPCSGKKQRITKSVINKELKKTVTPLKRKQSRANLSQKQKSKNLQKLADVYRIDCNLPFLGKKIERKKTKNRNGSVIEGGSQSKSISKPFKKGSTHMLQLQQAQSELDLFSQTMKPKESDNCGNCHFDIVPLTKKSIEDRLETPHF